MVKLQKLNGYTKLIVAAVVLLGIVAGWSAATTSMKKDIATNRDNIALLRNDIAIIKTDVKELLKRP